MEFEDNRKEKGVIDLTEFRVGDIAVVHNMRFTDEYYLVIEKKHAGKGKSLDGWPKNYSDYSLLDLNDLNIGVTVYDHDTSDKYPDLSDLFRNFDPQSISRIKGKFAKVVVNDKSK